MDMSKPLGKEVDVCMMCDSDHAGDKRTRCSCNDFLIFCKMALIDLVSKKQATIKTSVFGAEFNAMKHGIEKLQGLCYKLCMMGIPLTGPSLFIHADNKLQVTNLTISESTLKKKCNSICYQAVQESVTMGELSITHIVSEDNLSDPMTKVTRGGKCPLLVGNILLTFMMTIPSNEARPANPDQLILMGLKKSASSYSTYLRLTF